jgi:arginyl-tRNA synthetase
MKDIIAAAIREVLRDLGIDGAHFVVEHPAELSHGDYASNVALVAAKQLGEGNKRRLEG